MKWNIKQQLKTTQPNKRQEKIINILLQNRNIKNTKTFFNPPHPSQFTLTSIGIDPKQANKAILRIKKAVQKQEQIIVYGDYDADGITATAIMWETLYQLGANVLPYIPNRFTEGYGMKIETIKKLKTKNQKLKLIITVDQGIVAHQAVKFCNQQKIDVIVTDHHQPDKIKPPAHAIIHTTQTSGSGVAWWFCQKLFANQNKLELATIGTITDLLPLVEINRSLVYHGLKQLRQTQRPGLLTLLETANIRPNQLQTYHIGYIIGPRLNAMGRLQHALESLRLLCTTDSNRANNLALVLDQTNHQRQDQTQQAFEHALQQSQNSTDNIIVIGDQSYPEGIIGLIAGKLVEKFHKPTIVFSIGKKQSKASARSIENYDIIQAIRTTDKLLQSAGGHPMAAGLTLDNQNFETFRNQIIKHANQNLTSKDLIKITKIDTAINLSDINQQLYGKIQTFAPFGFGNYEPIFATQNLQLIFCQTVGKENKHLKFQIKQNNQIINAIDFNQGHWFKKIKPGQLLDLIYSITENTWNNRRSLELKIKDIHLSVV